MLSHKGNNNDDESDYNYNYCEQQNTAKALYALAQRLIPVHWRVDTWDVCRDSEYTAENYASKAIKMKTDGIRICKTS